MSYLLDKKIKKKRFFYIIFGIIVCLILFFFRLSVFNGLSFVSNIIFRPVLVLGNSIGEKFENFRSFFAFKNSLYSENKSLKSKLEENSAMLANYNSVLVENVSLKEILGRKEARNNLILSAILAKPNQSPYDTLVIDAGTKQGLRAGDIVFAFGNVPVGRVSDVYPSSSKVILFSNAGEKTQTAVGEKKVFMEVAGRGGGNFEMIVPRDFTIVKGDVALLPGIFPYVLGVVEIIISDPRDPFIKALLVSPVNIQELKFVEVEIQ
ncbi:hypothetical protein A3H53_03460 [Candidatus Nomurabacteria bacterium RIFCSPLOWO2_02_FULL_40_10]|uniref:Rod shape-determining protein MreC beta-barrel core domain-containing protein n=2 Tax=Candidatus Nomuraibacteriota TaxID=1752729 RepID=A0A1F6XVN5_9BACT|nr:MAG: hypothetical protein A2642_04920 [Candidatus Nomurabacteria bacterium RIFCSPHIGHO2_01_FULL_39_10]OGI98182.1 MAG: hypothetical protein A3H53_03460 [Candidatus Nomurabacteria bacterium RIFCSPLOWO2_02_FULL_40_10]